MEKQEISQDVGKSSHDVRVVLQLTKANIDAVGVQHNVAVGVRDAQIPNADQQLQLGPAKLALELSL